MLLVVVVVEELDNFIDWGLNLRIWFLSRVKKLLSLDINGNGGRVQPDDVSGSSLFNPIREGYLGGARVLEMFFYLLVRHFVVFCLTLGHHLSDVILFYRE